MENMNPESLLRKAQALGEDIKEMESIDVMGAYQQAQTQIKTNRRRSMYNQLMRYAAFLTIPLLLSSLILGYLYWGATDTEEKYAEVMAATGSVIRYELPDHSVYVYGTKFNVNAYEDDNSIETVLEKGKVNVISPDGKTTVQLAPGERLLYNKVDQKLLKGKVDVYEKVAWKDGKLIFRNAELGEIFKRLARHFNVDIQFNNISGKEYKYRATFRNETLPQILDYLAKSAALKWRTEEAVQQADDTFTKKKIIVDLY